MKRMMMISLVACMLGLSACAESGKGQVLPLDKTSFLTKVVNYERDSSEWKYLGDKPAIVDFYATWCGPCKRLAPVLDELAMTYKKDIYVYKVDVDQEPELAALFNVQSIPTLLFIPMNELPQVSKGAMPKEELDKAIKEFLLKK